MMRPFPFSAIKATLLQGGLCFLAAMAVGQEKLQVNDLFQPTVSEPAAGSPLVTFAELNAERIPTIWPALEECHQRGETAVVLATTEVLLAWIPPEAPDYGEALWHRARAFDSNDDLERVDRIASAYLKAFPKGPRTGWFLIRVARGWMQAGKAVQAAEAWALVLDEKLPMTEEEAVEAAIVFDSAFRPLDVRRALSAAGTFSDRPEVRRMLVRSLLFADDATVTLPELADVSDPQEILLRGLLAEARGDRAGAAAFYAKLAQIPGAAVFMGAAQRRGEDAWRVWPPAAAPVTSP